MIFSLPLGCPLTKPPSGQIAIKTEAGPLRGHSLQSLSLHMHPTHRNFYCAQRIQPSLSYSLFSSPWNKDLRTECFKPQTTTLNDPGYTHGDMSKTKHHPEKQGPGFTSKTQGALSSALSTRFCPSSRTVSHLCTFVQAHLYQGPTTAPQITQETT